MVKFKRGMNFENIEGMVEDKLRDDIERVGMVVDLSEWKVKSRYKDNWVAKLKDVIEKLGNVGYLMVDLSDLDGVDDRVIKGVFVRFGYVVVGIHEGGVYEIMKYEGLIDGIKGGVSGKDGEVDIEWYERVIMGQRGVW